MADLTITTAASPLPRPTLPFLAGYTLALVGANLSFLPLLAILLPLKAGAVAPAGKAELLSQVLLVGALIAGPANILAGAVSDRTVGRFGRRRPWILAGLAGVLLAYGLIAAATTPTALLAGVVGFQLALNLMYAPLTAIVADRIPETQRARLGGVISLGNPLATLIGSLIVGAALPNERVAYLAIGLVLLAAIGPFAAGLKDAPLPQPAREGVEAARAPMSEDFLLAFAARFSLVLGWTLASTYMLYHLQARMDGGLRLPGSAAQALATLGGVSSATYVAASLASGWLSDRLRRQRAFLIAAAFALAAAAAVLAAAGTWPQLICAYLLMGAAMGGFHAVDVAVSARVLPSQHAAGAGLGLLNLANTLPQLVAPILGYALLATTGPAYDSVYLAAAGAAVLGALAAWRIRGIC